ncbi:MAG: bifunctional folylpolyglutamate synthase/dihydrofolate synthase, partial [Rhodospirillales bacterium]|nr:bifunctional folylpolyglutamate synthase/dihydrofolate synthase [Rhodospirillales bacterium]
VMALTKLSDQFKVSGQQMSMGLKTTRWPARFQHLSAGPLIDMLPDGWELWLDGGHNEAAALVIADEIRSWRDQGDMRPVHLIFGMLNSKEANTFLGPLVDYVSCVDTVTIPGEENALSAEDLAQTASESGHQSVTPQPDVKSALTHILSTQKEPARVLICGSLYLAGTILAENG